MRISDWSSDVCSSDLCAAPPARRSAPGIRTAARQCRASSPCSSCPDSRAGHPWPACREARPTRTLGRYLGYLEPSSHVSRSEEHTSELQSLMRISYAVFCLQKKTSILNSLELYTTITNTLY